MRILPAWHVCTTQPVVQNFPEAGELAGALEPERTIPQFDDAAEYPAVLRPQQGAWQSSCRDAPGIDDGMHHRWRGLRDYISGGVLKIVGRAPRHTDTADQAFGSVFAAGGAGMQSHRR